MKSRRVPRRWLGFSTRQKMRSEAVERLRSSALDLPIDLPPFRRSTTGRLRAYCTVRLIVVICVRAPDCAVTTTEAGARFIWLLLPEPHPVEASSVPAIRRLANPPSNSENNHRRFAPAPAAKKKQPNTPSPVNAIPIVLVAP